MPSRAGVDEAVVTADEEPVRSEAGADAAAGNRR